jgi:hypothetical protein
MCSSTFLKNCQKKCSNETAMNEFPFWRGLHSGVFSACGTLSFKGRQMECRRVARFFLTQYAKTGKNIPNYHNITNGLNIYQDFPFYGPPKFTQIGIFGLKNTIWQPRSVVVF